MTLLQASSNPRMEWRSFKMNTDELAVKKGAPKQTDAARIIRKRRA
ncbi:hypothetical protein [Stutzerimonas xanthomarina]